MGVQPPNEFGSAEPDWKTDMYLDAQLLPAVRDDGCRTGSDIRCPRGRNRNASG
jgi:hypothetical protein